MQSCLRSVDNFYRNTEFELARANWHEALLLDPGNVEAIRNLARLHVLGPLLTRDLQELRALVPQLAATDGESETSRLPIAMSPIRLGDFAKGLEHLQSRPAVGDWQVLSMLFSAMACRGLGDDQRSASAIAHADKLRSSPAATTRGELADELQWVRNELASGIWQTYSNDLWAMSNFKAIGRNAAMLAAMVV